MFGHNTANVPPKEGKIPNVFFFTNTSFDALAISDFNYEWILNLAKLCSIEPGDPFPGACLTKQWKIFLFLKFSMILQSWNL